MLKEKYISVAGKDKRTRSKTVLRILGCCVRREGGGGQGVLLELRLSRERSSSLEDGRGFRIVLGGGALVWEFVMGIIVVRSLVSWGLLSSLTTTTSHWKPRNLKLTVETR